MSFLSIIAALDLPPPPASWLQSSGCITEERTSSPFNRKRKSAFDDDDESGFFAEAKRPEFAPTSSIAAESEGSEDDEEDSADEDDDEDSHNDMSKYLDTSDGLGDLTGLYGDINYEQQLNMNIADASDPLGLSQPSTSYNQGHDEMLYPGISNHHPTHQPWQNSSMTAAFDAAHSERLWPQRYGESEADVAVESIMGAGQDPPDCAGLTTDDLVAPQASEEDDEEEDDEEEDDDDEEDNMQTGDFMDDSASLSQQPCDVQMQSAIDSILDMPNQQQQAMGSFYPNDSFGQPFDSGMLGGPMQMNHGGRGGGMRPFSSSHTRADDPMLDEAVKSILS